MSRLYKVSMIGTKGVGKSSITLKYVQNIFPPTFEVMYDNYFRKAFTANGDECIIDVLDPGDFESLERYLEQYIVQNDGILLIYSITSRESFDALGNYYTEIIQRKQDGIFVLVGTKSDLEISRQVSTKEGEELANTFNCHSLRYQQKQEIILVNVLTK